MLFIKYPVSHQYLKDKFENEFLKKLDTSFEILDFCLIKVSLKGISGAFNQEIHFHLHDTIW